ncbi:bestrophin [Mesorhizobium sp. B2-5-13]|uniref:bestrophin family protein n=1 Tax=unclassified Mesorhizobium TaxID=325217 RepID=UPI001128C567|nr:MULTISPECIES: bestrophin family ion channel [unclassified Mesorhizobium]TPJ34697.1 bestrophin [Mesorhizobium sp. B2-6-5]TPJ74860.1 bestrophin [Mesorhizobium sp. B2-5-13]TPK41248.1 bestrophin [Mesorhizobium sp. B2-5-5]TPM06509.1 bestrophin [Mesorhizobium sp. B2-3-11]
MYVGRSYKVVDFALWSRRSVLYMVVVSGLAVAAYRFPGIAGFSVPWSVVLVLGTTVSLVAGFKNSQVLTRSGEALQAFTQITASSRMWSNFCRDFLDAPTARKLIYRHIAWMTALRYALRRPMPWESMGKAANTEYRRRYHIQEDGGSIADELRPLLGDQTVDVLKSPRPAIALLELQSVQVNGLLKDAKVPAQVYVELTKLIRDFHDQQARCDRIKNNPYPRQYAIVSSMFVMIFCTLLPFGVVPVFADMGKLDGMLGSIAIWLTIPFSTLLGWAYMSLDQVGESSANPFEGNANDVPISQICRDIEIEMRAGLGESDLPKPLLPVNDIAM